MEVDDAVVGERAAVVSDESGVEADDIPGIGGERRGEELGCRVCIDGVEDRSLIARRVDPGEGRIPPAGRQVRDGAGGPVGARPGQASREDAEPTRLEIEKRIVVQQHVVSRQRALARTVDRVAHFPDQSEHPAGCEGVRNVDESCGAARVVDPAKWAVGVPVQGADRVAVEQTGVGSDGHRGIDGRNVEVVVIGGADGIDPARVVG